MLNIRLLDRLRERRGDRGSVAVFTSIFAIAVVFLTALIMDGGIAMNARERAADIAGQAARAAAGDIDVGALRDTGKAVIGPGACTLAGQLVDHYASMDSGGVDRVNAASMIACDAPAGGDTATVRVQITTTSLVGGIIGGFTESASDTATAQCGITEGANC
jgi:Flp pilus assembly protein TadG